MFFNNWLDNLARRLTGTMHTASRKRNRRRVYSVPAQIQTLESRALLSGNTAPTSHWTGAGGDNLWSDAANWDVLPNAGDNLVFQGTPQTTVNDFPAGTPFGSIQFLSPSGWGTGSPQLPPWQVTGNAVTLGGADAILSDPNPAGSEAIVYFNLPVLLNSDMTMRTTSSDSVIEVTSAIDTAGHTLTVDAQGEALLAGDISGSGGLVLNEGFLLLSGNNSFTGPTVLLSGTVHADSPMAFGDSTTPAEIGTGVNVLDYSSLAEPLDLNACNFEDFGSVVSGPIVTHGGNIGGTVNITAPVTVYGSIELLALGSSGLDLSGGIVEGSPNSFIFFGAGSPAWPVVLSGPSSSIGTAFVGAGTLQVDSTLQSAEVVVGSGGTLDGAGTINASVAVLTDGTLKPSDSLGNLTAGNVAFEAGGIYSVALGATQSDQLTVTGNVDLGNSTLQLAPGYTPGVGTQFEIINNTGANAVANTFAGLPEGSVFTAGGSEFRITYQGGDGNDVVLTVVKGVVVNTNDSGPGSLRQAILDVDANTGINQISFDIPGSGAHTIQPLSALPAITDPVTIDGWSQPGFAGTPLIEINGSLANSDGLVITGGSTTVRGLVVNGFAGNGVDFYGAGGDVLQGSYIGTDVTGEASVPNGGDGVSVTSPSNLIGTNGDGVNDAAEDNLISGNQSYGVMIASGSGNVVAGNRIGTDVTGTQALANGAGGIRLDFGANNTRIGTAGNDIDNVGERNLISGNNRNFVAGVLIYPGSSNNVVAGNYIGTDVTGTQSLPNSGGGISIYSDYNFIGTNASGVVVLDNDGNNITRNVISGNDWAGITLAASHNVVAGNYIGTDPSGLHWNGNFGYGIITFGADYNQIGTNGDGVNDDAERNVISGNTFVDIFVDNTSAYNVISGNLIGTDVTGTVALSENFAGIALVNGALDNTIGGTIAAERNIISGHKNYDIYGDWASGNVIAGNYVGTDITGERSLGDGNGIYLGDSDHNALEGNVISGFAGGSLDLDGPASVGNVVTGNFLGTDATGTVALADGNPAMGITGGATDNIIGGTTTADRNIISGANVGVYITGIGTSGNLVEGNYIGTDVTGTIALGNNNGVIVAAGATSNTIGGVAAGQGNTIAYNGGDGVLIGAANDVSIRGNSIHDNGGLGINLGSQGGNYQQSYPTLTGALAGTTTSVTGTLSSTPNSTFTIDFYSSPTADPSGYGEGQFYLGSTTVTTDATGNAVFVANGLASTGAGQIISATATDANGNTSQFSADISSVVVQSTTTSLAESTATATYGDTVTFTATVIPQFSGVPSGSVTFYEVTSTGGIISQLGTSSLSNGAATLPVATLSAGTHYIAAKYTSSNPAFTDSALSSPVKLVVARKSVTGVIAAYNKVYDGTTSATLESATLTGILPADLGNVTLTVGSASFSDANAGTNKLVTATGLALSGSADGNYVLAATTATTTANITAKELTASGSTQNSINISKAGTLTFAISNVSGEITGDTRTTYQLFNGAIFTLKIGSNTYSVVSTASVDASTGTIYVSWRLTDALYNDLLAVLGTGTPSAKQLTDLIVVGYSKDGNYEISADCMTQIFSSGKVIWS